MIAAPKAPPAAQVVRFVFEGHAVEMPAAAAWDRAQNVHYRTATHDRQAMLKSYLRLGEWLCGLRVACADRFDRELAARGMHRSRCYRAMRLYRKSVGGELEPVVRALAAEGREPSVRAVLGRIATPKPGAFNVSRATRENHPEPGGSSVGFGGFGDLEDGDDAPTETRLNVSRATRNGLEAVPIGPAVRLAPGAAELQARAVGGPARRPVQLGLADLYADAKALRGRAEHVGRMLEAATEAVALSVADKVHRAGELLEEIERDLAR